MLRLSLILATALLLTSGCGGGSDESNGASGGASTEAAGPAFEKEGTLAFVRGGRDTLAHIDVEVAETSSERSRGLMQRESLPPESGMIFLFDENRERRFWMKNTPMALDIFFANADSQIVRVAKNTTPYSTAGIESGAPAQFVVEVPAGYADRRGIFEGDHIRFRRGSRPLRGGNARPGSAAGEPGS